MDKNKTIQICKYFCLNCLFFSHFHFHFHFSRDEIFNFLSGIVSTAQDVEKLKVLFGYLGPRELRHIDFLMYLMKYYSHSQPTLMKAIIEILQEHEIVVQNIMQNIG